MRSLLLLLLALLGSISAAWPKIGAGNALHPESSSSEWPGIWQLIRAIRDTSGSGSSSRFTSTKTAHNANTSDVVAQAPAEVLGKPSSDKVVSVWDSVRSSAASTWQGALDRLTGVQEYPKMSEKREVWNVAMDRVKSAARSLGLSEVGRAVSSSVGRWSRAMADSVGSAAGVVNSAFGTVLHVINTGLADDSEQACYSRLGCFSLSEPWTSPKRPLPRMNSPEQIQTRFFLHTRNTTDPDELLIDSEEVNSTRFLNGRKTFIIIHGFNDKSNASWIADLKDALLSRVECNVIVVDWFPGATATKNYLQAAANTRIVGAEVARLMESLEKQAGLALDLVHAVGHSLGAHVAGYAGKALTGKIGRITALDAAQPGFEDQDAQVRIAETDARFVDAIHTNGAPFIPTLGFGVMHPVGHVDFYLNGGTVQPGCFAPKLPPVNTLADIAALPVSVLGEIVSCSHRRAIEYFTEAVRSDCRMWGKRIEDISTTEPNDLHVTDVVPSVRSSYEEPPWTKLLPKPSLFPPFPPLPSLPPLPLFANVFGESPTTRTGLLPFPSIDPLETVRSQKRKNLHKRSKKFKRAKHFSKRSASEIHHETTERTSSKSRTTPPPSCDSQCIPIGLDSDRYGLTGMFSVRTADHSPYCR